MLTQADDFKAECEALYNLLSNLDDADFDRVTQFKGWTINDVLEHLHIWNWAANESMADEASFIDYIEKIMSPELADLPLKEKERQFLDGSKGMALLEKWRAFYLEMADRFRAVDPKMRLKWAGPDMSARSSITARLMETWAHGQEVYDVLGVERQEQDHIQNIVVLGVNTFGWTYMARKTKPPGDMPYLELTAPSGEIWKYGEPSDTEYVKGAAADFCRIVTQVRNIADTSLEVVGPVASDWMSKAQCFAGPAEAPPAKGARHTANG
ncbi:TIGR03084 family metal-binding protein [Alphaproteobacteria bacterium]|nr:TIGR03084 family metal-binding protein [Alphaproteobacteria bacterium]